MQCLQYENLNYMKYVPCSQLDMVTFSGCEIARARGASASIGGGGEKREEIKR